MVQETVTSPTLNETYLRRQILTVDGTHQMAIVVNEKAIPDTGRLNHEETPVIIAQRDMERRQLEHRQKRNPKGATIVQTHLTILPENLGRR